MKAIEFAQKLKDIATNYKTLYVMGCFGAPMTDANKKRYCSNHSYNKKAERTAMIQAASADTFGFDCVCLIKGVLWGWNGDTSKSYGGAVYKANDVPDIGANNMINVCSDISTDFSKIEIGEAVWMEGHIGVYIGDGLAVECTPAWKNNVQITACNRTISGYNRRNWTKHGKLPYIEYGAKEVTSMSNFEVLDVVKIKEGVTKYSNGKSMASWVPSSKLYVRKISGNEITISTLKEGAITGTVWATDLVLVEKAKKESPVVVYTGTPSTGSEADQKKIWDYLLAKIGNEYGVAGLMGNLYAECGLRSNNLQQTYEKSLGYTDETYTAAVDNGTYTNFIKDSAGYGLAQWTYWSRKERLYNYARGAKKSIGDFQMQLDYLWYEIETFYKGVLNTLKNSKSVKEASDAVLHSYEAPADQSEAVENKRASYSQGYYDKFHVVKEEPKEEVKEEPKVETPAPQPEAPKNEAVEEVEFSESWIKKLLKSILEYLLKLLK